MSDLNLAHLEDLGEKYAKLLDSIPDMTRSLRTPIVHGSLWWYGTAIPVIAFIIVMKIYLWRQETGRLRRYVSAPPPCPSLPFPSLPFPSDPTLSRACGIRPDTTLTSHGGRRGYYDRLPRVMPEQPPLPEEFMVDKKGRRVVEMGRWGPSLRLYNARRYARKAARARAAGRRDADIELGMVRGGVATERSMGSLGATVVAAESGTGSLGGGLDGDGGWGGLARGRASGELGDEGCSPVEGRDM
jgi:hypothetical protein